MEKRMNIYFAGSIRGGRQDAARYTAMVAFLQRFGDVLTEHVGDPGLSERGDDGPNDRFIHDRDMAWLKESDLVVAETTTASLGVGYELGWAAALRKPTLCLFRGDAGRRLSAMVAGCPGIKTVFYSRMEEAQDHIIAFIDALRRARDPDHENRP
jgi:2'-deoxynucleoside 5'-phosphate N-hydrolase